MPTTRGDLQPAMIVNLTTMEQVHCMFNPHEYTVSKQNTWEKGTTKGKNVPRVKFSQGGAQNLKLQLFFDTYVQGTDVRVHTRGLWKMMMVSDELKNPRNDKSEPPKVAFHWGKFYFKAVITNLSQKFSLFLKDGTPVRTTVDVSFQQVEDELDFMRQNPTSGGGPPIRTHTVQAGERIDLIAARIYGDSTKWRRIAEENDLAQPMRLQPGRQLVIPPLS